MSRDKGEAYSSAMGTTIESSAVAPALLSVFESTPELLGGIPARQGFAFQDDVAAGFYIKMLLRNDLIEVACETYDDIRLVWQRDAEKIIEFVQVKAEHPDQLWTVAKLCERTKSATKPDGCGSSILEKSLGQDKFLESTWFRIVTCRQTNSDLELLETRERGHEHRSVAYPQFKALAEDVCKRLDGAKSIKGSDTTYWLLNTCWDVIPERDVKQLNRQELTTALHQLGFPSDPDTVKGLYENLLALAKETAEYGAARWKEKAVSRNELLDRLGTWINPYPDLGKTEKLEQKLVDAGLDQVCLDAAKDHQRYYLRARRQAGYLETQQIDNLDWQVLDRLHALRSSLDSGKINETGVDFHNRCLDSVRAISAGEVNPSAPVMSGYLAGCMYEITARCRHRFTKFRS